MGEDGTMYTMLDKLFAIILNTYAYSDSRQS